ncbi:MAG: hypothetical protein GDA36_11755 [Rhodobacteraceae bacterium]|nr:hypothetical protein [Paracoccaceae bacterium]
MIFWPGFVVQVGDHGPQLKKAAAAIIGATLVESAAPAPAAILTHRKTGPKRRSPMIRPTIRTCIPDMHFSADAQARWAKKGSKPMPNYKMTSNGFAHPDEARTRKASSTRSTWGTCEPGRPARSPS